MSQSGGVYPPATEIDNEDLKCIYESTKSSIITLDQESKNLIPDEKCLCLNHESGLVSGENSPDVKNNEYHSPCSKIPQCENQTPIEVEKGIHATSISTLEAVSSALQPDVSKNHEIKRIKKFTPHRPTKTKFPSYKNDNKQINSKTATASDRVEPETSKTGARSQKDQKTYACKECNKILTTSTGLNKHSKIHTGEKPFSCTVCGKKFIVSSTLTRHMRIHTGDKPYSCFACERTFNSRSILNVHERVHTGEKPYICDICGKMFSDVSTRQKHRRIHTGEKPYSCGECGQLFREKSSLNSHMVSHTGEKPFACADCDKTFARKTGLTDHKRCCGVFFTCEHCGLNVKTKYNLNKHMRSHSKLKT